MRRCSQVGCGWVAIAPSEEAARRQYEAHLAAEHVEMVDEEVPEGHVQVRTDDGDWETMTSEEARKFYRHD